MYKEKALQLLVRLQDLFDEKGLEDSFLNGLELIVKSPSGTYQINYHGVTDQIWLSSPLTGAHHFEYKNDTWISTRSKQSLNEILFSEI